MKIIFMGTPEFASYILSELLKSDNEIIAVVTQPDKKVGRKQEIKYSEVKQVALEHNIEIIQPLKIGEITEQIKQLNADIIVTAAYGQFIPKEILDTPKFGSINVHGSLLPKYRGGAPIHYAIKNGESKTGVTIMRMIKQMDAGNIITQSEISIEQSDTLLEVYTKMKIAGAQLLLETLPLIASGNYEETVQDENEVTFALNITREQEKLNFNEHAQDVYNHVRAFNPFPTTFFEYNNLKYKVFKTTVLAETTNLECGSIVEITKDSIIISCLNSLIAITEFQPEGKKRMLVKDYLNGANDFKLGGKLNV